MAEWTGQKRTLNSIAEDVPPRNETSVRVPRPPEAPGATSSPQLPGETPDQPIFPAEPGAPYRLWRATAARSPSPAPHSGSSASLRRSRHRVEASDWEQGPSATEELRKVDPALLTPSSPRRRWSRDRSRDVGIATEALRHSATPEVPMERHPRSTRPLLPPLGWQLRLPQQSGLGSSRSSPRRRDSQLSV